MSCKKNYEKVSSIRRYNKKVSKISLQYLERTNKKSLNQYNVGRKSSISKIVSKTKRWPNKN